MTDTSKITFSILALCILSAATYLTLDFMSPPVPQTADIPATAFSAGRAMQDLAVIAREPHPMGESQAHADVRDYLIDEIRALGLEPQVQKTFGLRVVHAGWVIAGAVENVLVRLPGTGPDGAILLMAHYDSAPDVPGAADNGSGVVTILEILRALQARPALRHDVIFLFTDGEEPGTIGAVAFVAQHPWFEEVKLALNLDTITDAPPTLYRTSAGNGPWVQALARTASRPTFASLPYHLFPGGETDLVPLGLAGVRGADFYAMGGFPELHTALDQPQVVNPASVQHTGDQLLAMVYGLGNQPTLDMHVSDQTFFPVLGRLVHYPNGLAVPLASLAGLCFLATLAYGFYRRDLTWRGLGLGFLTFLLSLVLSVGIASLLWLGIQALHPEYGYSGLRPHLSDDFLYAIGFIAFTLTVFAGSTAVVRKKITASDLAAGALVFWLPISILAAFLVPMTSYLGSWVLLAGGLALMLGLPARGAKGVWTWSGVGFLTSPVLATFLWVPVIYISYLAGSPQFILMIGLAALWIGSMIPILDWISTPKRWILPLAAALVGVGCLVAGHFLVGKETSPPLINPVGYWLDANEDEAYWIGFSEEMDRRQTDLLVDPVQKPYQEIFPEAPSYAVLVSPAPLLDLYGPQLEVIKDVWMSGRRSVEVQITTSMKDRVYVIIPGEASVLAITLPNTGKTELPPCDDELVLRFDGTPAEGLELGFDLDLSGSFQILVVEEKTGLPSFPGLFTQAQAGTMRSPGEFYQGIPTDFTAIYRAFTVSESDQ